MTPAALLTELFERVLTSAEAAVDGLTEDQLATRPGDGANPIAWLVWHLARVQDDHVATVAGLEQVYTAQGYAERFDLPFDVSAIGYGQSREEVGQVRADAALLTDYLRAVHAQTTGWVAGLEADDLDRVVDEDWDPPVTLGVRLASVANDDLQHAGQAAYVRGLLGA
ncbi:mycothiol transferase [Nocardioides lijunqiniae]|uniref:mycothiol transferase n=1 Tax=Nocardioides lijunqiniae TaxID=2760832 RepID=UPI0018777624|nr:DUF664 domain-containing protein [Nocardioides lijunqiniae]